MLKTIHPCPIFPTDVGDTALKKEVPEALQRPQIPQTSKLNQLIVTATTLSQATKETSKKAGKATVALEQESHLQ